MEIELSQRLGRVPVTVMRVKGNVDTLSYETFQKFGETIFLAGAEYILLDLEEVPFISSAGFQAIGQVFKMLHEQPNHSGPAPLGRLNDGTYKSPHLKLLKPNARVVEALHLAGFDTFLEVFHDLDAAIASY